MGRAAAKLRTLSVRYHCRALTFEADRAIALCGIEVRRQPWPDSRRGGPREAEPVRSNTIVNESHPLALNSTLFYSALNLWM
jgi:hypothetical protein